MTSNCVVGELKGQFTHKEESILKRFQPYRISTKLFRSDDYPHITGWGTLGITGSDGKISSKSEEGIIIVNRDSENPSLVKIFFMAGVPDDIPNTIPLLMKYASNNI
ncbi:MAG: hypothetical protein LIP09_11480 [Bacteroidales bacterium]|nr:hypothetical protein [Bacteroidales bacterium]